MIAIGASGEHAGFAGTLSIGTEVLAAMIVEIVRTAGPEFDRVVIVNAHGGNLDAVRSAAVTCEHEGRPISVWHARLDDADAHAGSIETSVMLAIDPQRVRLDRAEPGNTAPLREILDDLRTGVSPRSRPTACSVIRPTPRRPEVRRSSPSGSTRSSPFWNHEGMSQPVAIVTGAGRGIGAATVAALVADGWWVAAVDRCSPHPTIAYPMASSDDLADVVTGAGGNAAAFEADVSVGAAVAEVVASVTDARGRLDAVVCAAGVVAGGSPAWEIDDTEWDAVIGTDLTGVFATARAAVPALLASPHGRIVTVASAAGSLGLRHMSHYAAAKHGVIGFTRSLAADLAGTGSPPTPSRPARPPPPGSTSRPVSTGSSPRRRSSAIKSHSVD